MAKSKKRKNKKDLDFQKVKLKVGRKLKRDDNETKAEFSSRKIVLREIKSYTDDPLTALAKHSDHISVHGKLTLLNHFNSGLSPRVVGNLNKPILDSLSKFVIDHSDQVRAATFKCLKSCYNFMRQRNLNTRDFLYSLKPYLDCAYTHVARDIVVDCHKFLDYFVGINDPQSFEPLMAIILRRYEVGNVSEGEKRTAIKLRRYYLRSIQKQTIEEALQNNRMEPLKWSPERFFLDLDTVYHFADPEPEREVHLMVMEKRENVCSRYLKCVKDEEETQNSNVETRSSKRRRRV